MMEVARTVILLLHPLLAIILLGWMLKQHSWRKRSRSLKGEERKISRQQHEDWGRKFVPLAIVAVAIAVSAQIIRALIDGKPPLFYFHLNIHGIFGIVGVGLLLFMTGLGKKVVAARESGEKWNELKLKHGRAADLVMILAILHGFIGFLYIFEVV